MHLTFRREHQGDLLGSSCRQHLCATKHGIRRCKPAGSQVLESKQEEGRIDEVSLPFCDHNFI